MSYTEVLTETNEQVTTVTLNRPDALNAITPTMLGELKQAIDAAGVDASVRVVVLTGAGRAFSAGVDLKSLNTQKIEEGSVGDVLDLPARALINSIQKLRKPVIAKVNGFCFTGALELALACDLFVVNEKAKLGDTHAKFGLRPTWGMSQRLPAAVGMVKAKELSFTARNFTGAEAAAMGIANRAVPAEELDAAVQELIDGILPNSPESISAYKVLYNKGAAKPLNKGLKFEYGEDFDISDTMERLADFL